MENQLKSQAISQKQDLDITSNWQIGWGLTYLGLLWRLKLRRSHLGSAGRCFAGRRRRHCRRVSPSGNRRPEDVGLPSGHSDPSL